MDESGNAAAWGSAYGRPGAAFRFTGTQDEQSDDDSEK
jgi:hypothetical protein